MAKHIFVTGGVVSSLGKGLTSASIGMLLEQRGLRVRLQKFDPYINVDPGTMSPYQHGEVYVLDDGAETDLDLGHYERFTARRPQHATATTPPARFTSRSSRRSASGDYRGKTVQVIPHVTDEIKAASASWSRRRRGRGHHRDRRHGRRHRGHAVPRGDPPVRARRRPAQLPVHPPHARPVSQGRGRAEDQADAALASATCARSASSPTSSSAAPSARFPKDECEKIALFCNVERRAVIEEKDKEFSIYEVPLSLADNKLDELDRRASCSLTQAEAAGHRRLAGDARPDARTPRTRSRSAFVGKYMKHRDAYKCVYESLDHAGHRPPREGAGGPRIEAEELAAEGAAQVAGGRGRRARARRVRQARHRGEDRGHPLRPRDAGCRSSASASGCSARRSSSPATSLGLEDANSTEFDKATPHPVVCLLEEQQGVDEPRRHACGSAPTRAT